MHANALPTYRRDIDGLRAIAVLAVVGYHTFPDIFPGGFVGVDVFFVISGFLISTIVFGGLADGSFSFWDFYARRIKRIFPALILMLVVVWLAGWLFLFPNEYISLGQHLWRGGAFISNFWLWHEIGYFDVAAELKPLLHLWSLSIEEQFYLVWPVTLALLWRFQRARGALLWAMLLGSFALCAWATWSHPGVAFYFPAARFWELLIGGMLAYYGQKGVPVAAPILPGHGQPSGPSAGGLRAFIGLGLLAIAIFGLDRQTPIPGWAALLPTLGTALLLSAGPGTWIGRRLLGQPVMVAVGLISYPLYLWHWPLLSFLRIITGEALATEVLIGAVALSFALAWATYALVEGPIRRRPRHGWAVALAGLMLACGVIGFGTARTDISGRLGESSPADLELAEQDWLYPAENGKPLVIGAGHPSVLLIGDSHMMHYFARVQWLVASGRAPTSVFLAFGGCPALPDVNRIEPGLTPCQPFFAEAMQRALDDPHIRAVAIGATWESYFRGLFELAPERGPLLYRAGDPDRKPIGHDSPEADAIFARWSDWLAAVRARGKRMFVMLSSPVSPRNSPGAHKPERLTGASPEDIQFVSRDAFEAYAGPVTRRLEAIAREAGATIIDPLDFLCDSARCPTETADGIPIYMDVNHLRATFTRTSATYIDQIFAGLRDDAAP